MPNVTISLDEETLKAGREYARRHKTSLNALIRSLLEKTVRRDSTSWLDECFEAMDATGAKSEGKRWTRDDLYDV
jgi:hypothetical protein